jgi:hypothetical protein
MQQSNIIKQRTQIGDRRDVHGDTSKTEPWNQVTTVHLVSTRILLLMVCADVPNTIRRNNEQGRARKLYTMRIKRSFIKFRS